jgi:hypothetical protein
MDAGRAANWALHGRPLSSRRGIYIFDRWAVESVSDRGNFHGRCLVVYVGRQLLAAWEHLEGVTL